MLNRLHQLKERIPLPVSQFWHRYGVFIVLILSLTGFWLGHGERYINAYLESTAQLVPDVQRRLNSGGYRFGYTLAYIVVRFGYAPEQAFPWVGLLWSLAVINYRFWLKPFVFLGSWVGRVIYVIAAPTLLASGLTSLLTLATGPNQVNSSVIYWVLGWFVLYGVWHYFREINRTRHALTETGTQAELTALKAQVNPHFLFNSLNNIFGTALTEGGQRTPDGVQQLSRLIRYPLEQTQATQVDMGDELRFVDEYVQFHRQFLPNEHAISFSYDWDEQPTTLPPLLLTPLIDHALQQAGNALIVGRVNVRQQQLHLQLTYPAAALSTESEAMYNVRQRLAFLYPDRYALTEQVLDRQATLDLMLQLSN
ncbi:histidine kinase [Fibrella sp. HMF5335]|uniref:Histidine kinase n=1 Tax=Fibrella rubiginis TaxID=2817060 RepID=A0A939GAQ1_9BACT|nr:sensor histidine kinase [Fibrella rubiginis]MBO0935577.1 histidine kinase [Fibrella rubiginis]